MVADLLIPSAKLIPKELQSIGKMPPVLYPLGSGIVFDYLYAQYERYVNAIRIVGYEGFQLMERSIASNRYLKTTLIRIGLLQDLAHTVFEGLNDSDHEVIINFGDTFVDEDYSNLQSDSFYYSEETFSADWTFFNEENGKLTEIIDKSSDPNTSFGKLFCGVFRFSDQRYFKKCLSDSFEDDTSKCSAFYLALLRYNQKYPLIPIETQYWYDLGHLDRYLSSKTKVKAREFNHIVIDMDRGILRKTSEDKEKFIGEISWYLKLPSDIEYCRPRIFTYSTSYNGPYVEMEYYSYRTVHELLLYGDLSYAQWKKVLDKIAFIRADFSKYKVCDDEIPSALREMYLDKTISRMERLSECQVIGEMLDDQIRVNGICFKPLRKIIDLLSKEIPDRLCDLDEFTIIHGDLCFTNMLIDDNYSFVKLIDPRGKFGKFDIYGDPRYDLAKLFHSVDGKYDFIIKNMFELKIDEKNNSIDFEINQPQRDFDLFELMQDVFKNEIGSQKDNIEFIEALLFLSMIPLHSENINHQLVMLGTGLQILDHVLDIRGE